MSLMRRNVCYSGSSRSTIELDQNSVTRKFRATVNDGKNYNTQFYNLDAIISVGYRVSSKRATQFRQWATQVLHQFAIREYVLDMTFPL